jgi:predicted aminopeptidase
VLNDLWQLVPSIATIAEGGSLLLQTTNEMTAASKSKKWPKVSWKVRILAGTLVLILVFLLSGCQTVSFYRQALRGQSEIFWNRESISDLLKDPKLDPKLKPKLELILILREYAESELGLESGTHYLTYADLKRKFVVWNVHASPVLSLKQKTWWYPVVGKLKYRGYFDEKAALDYSQKIAREGMDVYVEGVEAYSTLGWFSDPVLNTFIRHSEIDLADIIFHELAHQKVFIPGDTDFNEAFATAVAMEGVHRWLKKKDDLKSFERYNKAKIRRDEFVRLVLKTRDRLMRLYGETEAETAAVPARKPDEIQKLLAEKLQIMNDLKQEYEVVKKEKWEGYEGYDKWFAKELNNAQLNTISTYYHLVPGFSKILADLNHNLPAFYESVRKFEGISKEERHRLINLGSQVPEKP